MDIPRPSRFHSCRHGLKLSFTNRTVERDKVPTANHYIITDQRVIYIHAWFRKHKGRSQIRHKNVMEIPFTTRYGTWVMEKKKTIDRHKASFEPKIEQEIENMEGSNRRYKKRSREKKSPIRHRVLRPLLPKNAIPKAPPRRINKSSCTETEKRGRRAKRIQLAVIPEPRCPSELNRYSGGTRRILVGRSVPYVCGART